MNAKILKQKRKQLGLTQDSLAELLGVTRNTIINYENGGVIPISSENPAKILANHKSDKMTGVYAIGRSKRKNEALKKIKFG